MDCELLSVKEVATRLAVHEMTVWRLIWAGKLEAVRFGRSVRVPVDAIVTPYRTKFTEQAS